MITTRADLRQIVRNSCTRSMLGIEIGGGYRPLFKKGDGYNIRTIDYATREELVERYKEDPALQQMLDNFEEVDAVDDGSEFTELLDLHGGGGVDYIVGVHNFEHIPDPIRFLQRCGRALSDTGALYLIIPDRRGTFDYFRPPSSVGQWMEAYRFGRKVHSYQSLYDMFAYHTDGNGDFGTVDFVHTPVEAHRLVEELYDPDSYYDNHGFVYTPTQFRFIVTFVAMLGLIPLRVRKILVPANSKFEFLAIMDKQPLGAPDLKELAIAMVTESDNPRRTASETPVVTPSPALLRKNALKRFYHRDS